MRILLIEDDNTLTDFLKNTLERECFSVDIAVNGVDGSFLARTNEYDVVILDLLLPGRDGKEVCRDIRSAGKTASIIILSVETGQSDKVDLLNSGADDYLTKPFSFEELLARIRALLRRPKPLMSEVLTIGDLLMDVPKHTVQRSGQDIYLTKKEFELLEYMVRNQDQVLSRGIIFEHVWDRNGDIFSNTIETHILNLRKKMDTEKGTKLIHTIPGRGYKVAMKK